MLSKILIDFCKTIKIDISELKNSETPEALHFKKTLPSDNFKNLKKQNFMTLLKVFGDSLSVFIGLDAGPSIVKIESGQCEPDFKSPAPLSDQFKKKMPMVFDLVVDKTKLAAKLQCPGGEYRCLFFFFTDNFKKLIEAPLHKIENYLFPKKPIPTLIIISDSKIEITGTLLNILGEKNLDQYKNYEINLENRLADRIETYVKTAREKLSWIDLEIKNITPLHFFCRCKNNSTPEIEKQINTLLLHLCILFTANRSARENHIYKSYFSNSERTIELCLKADDLPNPRTEILKRFVIWCFESRDSDQRLPIVQSVIARELTGENPDDNYKQFCEKLDFLFNEARWHYRIFLDKAIEHHFENLQVINNFVMASATSLSQTFENITKNLTNTCLTAISAILLTFIASLLKSDIQIIIFRTGIFLYAFYLIAFPGLYQLGSYWHSYLLLMTDIKKRKTLYINWFGKPKVLEIFTQVDSRQKQFIIWFWLSVAIYGVLFLVTIALGVFASNILKYFEITGNSNNIWDNF